MVGEFTAFIKKEALFTKNDTMLLGVSGGIDSAVMAHLFAESPYRFAIAHVNFGLRGTDSDGDAQWVAALAQHYQVPLHTHRFATAAYAAEQGISTQMAARQLRYAWFEEVLDEHHYTRLAVAHHQDDQLETTLLNLCQGTGIAGLRGMLPRRERLVRPLLFATRAQIAAYADQHALAWREDRSNTSDAYQRNRIRHHVVPQLRQINPNLFVTYQRTRERLLATEQLLADEVRRVAAQCRRDTNDETWLDKATLMQHPQVGLVLGEMLRPFGFSYQQTRDLVKSIERESTPGKTFISSSHSLLVDRQQLIISKKSQSFIEKTFIRRADSQVAVSSTLITIAHFSSEAYVLNRQAEVAALDEALLTFPLAVRPWQAGDWFFPLGMPHRKKLSDFLIDQKVPLHRKASVLVVRSGDDIVWVVGWRIDHRYRMTEHTKKVCEISVATAE